MNKDSEHLRLLSIGYYVCGGIMAVTSLFPIFHVVIGILMVTGSFDNGDGVPPPPFVGILFAVVGLMAILIGMTIAISAILTGRFLARRKRYIFCLVVGGVSCLFAPIGTLLGVFTIIVLSRDSVKALFGWPVAR